MIFQENQSDGFAHISLVFRLAATYTLRKVYKSLSYLKKLFWDKSITVNDHQIRCSDDLIPR